MRRSEKQITDTKLIEEIFSANTVCRIALSLENQAYIVPMSYGYNGNTLYFHSAREGRKIDMLKTNGRACFEITDSAELVTDDTACGYGSRFRSLIGFGTISIVEDEQQRIDALQLIMKQHTGKSTWEFKPGVLAKTLILRLDIDSVTGKISGLG